jgi:Na+/proline symporter
MLNKIGWLTIFFVMYWAFCIVMGVRSSRQYAGARQFFIPTDGISTWVFVFAVTAATFAGWTFTGQAGQIFRDGLQYVNATFFVISIPLAGVLVLKRQWVLARKYGYVTPGEMYSGYFGGGAIAMISVGVALLFTVPFLATLLGASGTLIQTLTDGAVSRDVGMWVLSSVLLFYCVTGGLAAVAQVSVLQSVLFIGACTVLGLLAVAYAGGFTPFGQGLAQLASTPIGATGMTKGNGGGDYNGLFAIPGVIQFTAGLGRETPVGGPWTAIMSLTFVLSMMGIQFAPAFSVWGFASRSPRAFPIHLIWGSAFCVGVVEFIFAPLQGLGGLILGANGAVNAASLAITRILPELTGPAHGGLVASYIASIRGEHVWLIGLLAVAAVAAMQCTAAAYLVTTGNILSRDIYVRYFRADANWDQQRLVSRIAMLLTCLGALLMASFAGDAVPVLSVLAIPCSFQLLPALLAVLWLPWITRRGATAGLIAGLAVVVMTEPLGQVLTGNSLPWGRWPWTIHSGIWGMFFNLLVCLVISGASRVDSDTAHRAMFHEFLDQSASIARSARLKSAAWILVLGWTFFAVGPGVVLGNRLFGAPGAGYQAWIFGAPSIWAWQVLWWILGVGLVWFLAVKMEMSTMSRREAAALGIVVKQEGGDDEF